MDRSLAPPPPISEKDRRSERVLNSRPQLARCQEDRAQIDIAVMICPCIAFNGINIRLTRFWFLESYFEVDGKMFVLRYSTARSKIKEVKLFCTTTLPLAWALDSGNTLTDLFLEKRVMLSILMSTRMRAPRNDFWDFSTNWNDNGHSKLGQGLFPPNIWKFSALYTLFNNVRI
jgi:hypothetical protein